MQTLAPARNTRALEAGTPLFQQIGRCAKLTIQGDVVVVTNGFHESLGIASSNVTRLHTHSETGAALDDIRGKLVAARLTDGWRFLAGEARVEAMKYSKEAMWALERSVMYLLRIWSVGEDDDERAAASRQIAMTLDDHMDEKEDEEDEEDSEETEAAQRDTVTVTISEIMLWSTETYLWAMTDQFGTKMRAYAALRKELEGREFR